MRVLGGFLASKCGNLKADAVEPLNEKTHQGGRLVLQSILDSSAMLGSLHFA